MRTSVYLRIQHWDAAVELSYCRLADATRQKVTLLADQTQPFDLPAHIPALTYTTADFPPRGLPLRPNPQKAMRINGDYLFYLLAETDPAESFLMLDGDCCVNGMDLHGLIQRLEEEAVDLCTPFLAPCAPGDWTHWSGVQRAWFDEELGEGHGAEVYKSSFSFVFLSRRALDHLRARRLQMAEVKQNGIQAAWPICESVLPSELARVPGFTLRRLQDMKPGPMHFAHNDPLTPAEIDRSSKVLIQPLMAGRRLGEKVIAALLAREPEDHAAQEALLRKALARPLDADARQVLEAGLRNLVV